MDTAASVWLVLAAAAVAANLPFVNERLFAVAPLRGPKHLGWRVLELLVLFGGVIGLGVLLESRIGQRHEQGWEFYAVFFCLFLTLAFPGFVWRYLRRHRHS
ncbi:DUF2818 family protein [Aquabacterium sp. A7-Y]|uniref:DUF2818 family protein n=1 Tax=Aquabacterium sp. A7-Y TaxID=1349605 RepID=UPI00223CFC0D|nr:DUF2818 family protein [Aquabacterium sp. A7-Y]MCW7538138.1 DUF2818 family protein [Aquabacterium sp. A7-Y]